MFERNTINETALPELIDYATTLESQLRILQSAETNKRSDNYKELRYIKMELRKARHNLTKLQEIIADLNAEAKKDTPDSANANLLLKSIKRESNALDMHLGSLNRSMLSGFQQGVATTFEALTIAPASVGYLYLVGIGLAALATAIPTVGPAVLAVLAGAIVFSVIGSILLKGVGLLTNYIASELMANYNQSKIDGDLTKRKDSGLDEVKTVTLNELRPQIRHFSKCTKIGFFNNTVEQIEQRKAIIKTKVKEAERAEQRPRKLQLA